MKRGRPRRTREQGVTLLEVLISLGLVVIALMALLSTLTSATVGSSASSHATQATERAQSLIEAIRNAPAPAVSCLAINPANVWSNCESTCLSNQTNGGGLASSQSCIFTTSSMSLIPGPPTLGGTVSNQTVDRSGQHYYLIYDSASPSGPRSSFVQRTGTGNRVYDIQITVGWNDDNSAPAAGVWAQHMITLRSGVFL